MTASVSPEKPQDLQTTPEHTIVRRIAGGARQMSNPPTDVIMARRAPHPAEDSLACTLAHAHVKHTQQGSRCTRAGAAGAFAGQQEFPFNTMQARLSSARWTMASGQVNQTGQAQKQRDRQTAGRARAVVMRRVASRCCRGGQTLKWPIRYRHGPRLAPGERLLLALAFIQARNQAVHASRGLGWPR